MLNRSAVVVRYRQPFVDWINAVDPSGGGVTLAEANEDTTVYLVEAEDENEFRRWLALNGELLFEELLNDWYTDQDCWPPDRSVAVLSAWCAFEFHGLVFDTGSTALEDDELEE